MTAHPWKYNLVHLSYFGACKTHKTRREHVGEGCLLSCSGTNVRIKRRMLYPITWGS
jgi:hypothetical protein